MAPQDYTRRSFQAAAALIAVLVCVAFIPPQTICGIPSPPGQHPLSDVLRFDDKEAADETFAGTRRRVSRATSTASRGSSTPAKRPCRPIRSQRSRLPPTRCPPHRSFAFEWTPADSEPPTEPPTGDTARLLTTLSPIEDFRYASTTAPCTASARDWPTPPAAHPCASPYWATRSSRATSSRPTLSRTAATALLAGRGCGFAPMSSPLTGYRRTVGTRSAGWNSYNIMQRRTTPEALRGDYSVSGWLCTPRRRCDGALDGQRLPPPPPTVAAWRGCSSSAESRAGWNSRSNDSLHRTFDIPASEALRQIVVRAPVASLALRVVRGGAGFTGYGVQFEDAAGVTVRQLLDPQQQRTGALRHKPLGQTPDRRLRGVRSGHPAIRTEHHAGGGHQLLGLRRPRGEDDRLRAQLFPRGGGAGALDSDRSVKSDTRIRPDVVGAGGNTRSSVFLVGLRRHAGAGRHGTFRRQRLAGKDYTHINYAGGRQVAYALVDALDARVAAILRQRQQAALPEPVLDSSKIAALDETMNLRPQPIEPR